MKFWIERLVKRVRGKLSFCESNRTVKALLRSQRGFNLIEIMVVITIMGMLMGMVGIYVVGVLDDAKADTSRNQMKTIENALVMYKLDNGRYPSTTEGLQALISAPSTVEKAGKKYLNSDTVPKDGWDNDYLYFCPGTRGNHDYEIISYGADGREGGEKADADITSWDTRR